MGALFSRKKGRTSKSRLNKAKDHASKTDKEMAPLESCNLPLPELVETRLTEEKFHWQFCGEDEEEDLDQIEQLLTSGDIKYRSSASVKRPNTLPTDSILRETNQVEGISVMNKEEDKRAQNEYYFDLSKEYGFFMADKTYRTISIFPARMMKGNREDEIVIVHLIMDDRRGKGKIDDDIFRGVPVNIINFGNQSNEEEALAEFFRNFSPNAKHSLLKQPVDISGVDMKKLFDGHSNLQAVLFSDVISRCDGQKIEIKPCIVLYCSLKGYIPLGEDNFPSSINDIPTDIREGYVTDTGCSDFNNPLGLGCQISVEGQQRCGSIGLFTGPSGTGFITCAHVLLSNERLKAAAKELKPILEQSSIIVNQPGNEMHARPCGRLKGAYYGPVTIDSDRLVDGKKEVDVDIAVVDIMDRAPTIPLMNPRIESTRLKELGLSEWPNYNCTMNGIETLGDDDIQRSVFKCGAGSGITKGTMQSYGGKYTCSYFRSSTTGQLRQNQHIVIPAETVVTYTENMEKPVRITPLPFAKEGDSGAAVFLRRKNDIHPVGMVVSVMKPSFFPYDMSICTFVTPISAIEKALHLLNPPVTISNISRHEILTRNNNLIKDRDGISPVNNTSCE